MKTYNDFPKLNQKFYSRDVVIVARGLLGKTLVRSFDDFQLAGKIVEVEAYDQSEEAAHSYNGLSQRNKIMFQKGGLLYVYFIYGVHYCCNVVTGKESHGSAVLIRAIEPLNYIDILGKNRFNKSKINEKEKINLTNGPAKICQAYSIGKSENGTNLVGNKIYILDSPKVKADQIVETTRIGISKSTELPWRFYIKNNRYISR